MGEELKKEMGKIKELEEGCRRSKDEYRSLMHKFERLNEESQRMKEDHTREITRLKEEKQIEIQRTNQFFS
jgi:hypothetical protein